MMRALWTLPLIALPLLAACGPISVQQAERECYERARLAQQPRGEVRIGANSDGKAAGGLELSVSSDYILGKDPAAVFETCVMARSGQAPTRAVYDMPGWKG